MPSVLDAKGHAILDHERTVARAIGKEVIGHQPLSAWEIMIPPLLAYVFLRMKQVRDLFADNFLFTKSLALYAAFNMCKGESRAAAMAEIEAKTRSLLDKGDTALYSSTLQEKQILEIELLIDHYYRLLMSEGDSHSAMVRDAYGSKAGYGAYLDRLARAEGETNREAIRRLEGDPLQKEALRTMEAAAQRIRSEVADYIFKHNATPNTGRPR